MEKETEIMDISDVLKAITDARFAAMDAANTNLGKMRIAELFDQLELDVLDRLGEFND